MLFKKGQSDGQCDVTDDSTSCIFSVVKTGSVLSEKKTLKTIFTSQNFKFLL